MARETGRMLESENTNDMPCGERQKYIGTTADKDYDAGRVIQ
jgi:hypothetical protein